MTREEPARAGSRLNRGGWRLLAVCLLAGTILLLIRFGVLPPVCGMVALAGVLTLVFWQIRLHLASILLVFFSVLLLSVIATQRMPKVHPDRLEAEEGERLSRKWATAGKFNQNLPIVVHLIFDEMMSPGAITDDLPGGAATRTALFAVGEKHAFRTFDSVYSRYYYTSESIPNLMNREYLGQTGMDTFAQLHFDAKARSYTVATNAYFEDMAKRGYRTAVFQATYMNFCKNANVDLCETFDSFDPAGKKPMGFDAPIQRVTLWQTVLRAYAPSYTSEVGERILGRAYGLNRRQVGVFGEDEGGRYDVHRFPEWFDRFTNFAANVPRGSHVFAHFLVPHSPYLLLENCVVSGKVDNGYNLSQYPLADQSAKHSDYYDRYLRQLRCVARKLDDFMEAVSQKENYRDALIVVHGDHGSRISINDLVEDYKPRDFVDNYGAFFAVRGPAVVPGVDCEFVSLPEIFRRYVARPGTIETLRTRAPLPIVALSKASGNPKVEAPMPVFGCAQNGSATVP